MTHPTTRQVAAAMWESRPSMFELLLWAILALIGHWATGFPLAVFGLAVGLVLAAGTLQMALADLRKAVPAACDNEEVDHDAAD